MAAEFDYPRRGNYNLESPLQSVNVIDILWISYDSIWARVNLTVGCSQGHGAYSALWDSPQNPIIGTGQYKLGAINNLDFDSVLSDFPIGCNLRITDSDSGAGSVLGQDFSVVSSMGSPVTTYSSSSSTSTTSATSTQITQFNNTSSSATTTAVSSTSTPTAPAATLRPSDSTKSSNNNSSTGIIAGISASLGILILGIIIYIFIMWRRKRNNRLRLQRESLKPDGGKLYIGTKLELPNSDKGVRKSPEVSRKVKVCEIPDTGDYYGPKSSFIVDIPQELE